MPRLASSTSSRFERAVSAIEQRGITLVYPLPSRPDVPSLWHALHPRTPMHWSWNEDADPRVAALWHLRNEVSESGRVAYAKWCGGRATFFSLSVFHALLARFEQAGNVFAGLSPEASEILDLLRERSPLSTKELRAAADLRGKPGEHLFTRAMKQLWARLLIVGFGEVDDGAFPSLAVAATELMFEDSWNDRANASKEAHEALDHALEVKTFRRQFERSCKEIRDATDRFGDAIEPFG